MGAGGVRERTIEELTEFCKGKSILRLKTETGLSFPTLNRIALVISIYSLLALIFTPFFNS
jgi:hypothetical protein